MSLLPARVNHTIWKGATFQKVVTLLQGGLGSNPRNLTGFTGVLTIRDRDGVTLLTLTTENGGLTFGGAAGTVTITIASGVTAGLTWKTGTYDLLLTGGGRTDPYMQGTFNVVGGL